ncbi:MAG TPA: hypothetical protein VEU62_19735 [Bryobacterales bacterium]|nr:hypothetical protein [Bryobacterales bacterium]
MQHLTEDQLVLYYYGEVGDRAARGEMEEHLAACDACRASYQGLQEALAAVEAAPVPEPLEPYGALVWQRLEPQLPKRGGSRWSGIFEWRRWAAAGAMAALVTAAFLAGRFWPRPPGPRGGAQQAAANASDVHERILLVAVGDHLERSQMVLIELANARGTGPVDISAEQQRAEDLLDSNRLYRQTAASAGEAGMASVLDDLERVLLEIAHSPSQISAQELDELRRRIESQGILFKVRVIGSNVRAREQEAEGSARRGRL